MKMCVFVLAATTILVSLALPASGQQPYTFTKVMDLSTQRPDGNGLFTIGSTTTPAFDGQWVVFRDLGSRDDGSLQAIWSFNTKDSTFHRLVNLQTPAPGGTATFTDLHLLDTAPAVRNGTVIFLGRVSFGGQVLEGLYSVPAGGGTIVKVVDSTVADPSGGTFTLFDSAGLQTGGFAFDGTTVAFHGQGSALSVGVYSANPNGSSLSLIADSLHAYAASGASVVSFSAPLVGGGNVVVAGSESSGPATGYNGLYLGKAGNNGSITELVNSRQQLPGGTNAGFHTRFDAPSMGFDGTLVAFHADDAAAPAASPLSGLYWTDLTSHVINKIADVNSTLSGLGKLKNIGDQGVAVSQGNVLFRAADTTAGYPGNGGLYLWANGASSRIVGTGDLIDGKTVQVLHDPGSSALSGAGFAFLVEFGASNSFAIYYATPPVATTVASVSAATYSSIVAPNTIVSAFGQGLADSATGAALPLPLTLGNIALSVRDSAGTARAAQLYYAGPTQINYVVPSGTALGTAAVTVTKGSQTAAVGTIQVLAAVAPGLFTANYSGQGPAAAVAIKTSASGAQSWQYAAACGSAPASCVTLPLDLGVSTDQVALVLYGTGIRGYKTGVTAAIGGKSATPTVSADPQNPGMDLVTLPIDRILIGSGEVNVVVTVDGVAANTVKIRIN